MVSIHNTCASKKSKEMLKTIGESADIYSNYLQAVTYEQNAPERKMSATTKATDVARVDYEDLPTHKTKAYI